MNEKALTVAEEIEENSGQPATARDVAYTIAKRLTEALGRRPSAREVAEGYGCTPERIRQLLRDDDVLGKAPKSWRRIPAHEFERMRSREEKIEQILSEYDFDDLDDLQRYLERQAS